MKRKIRFQHKRTKGLKVVSVSNFPKKDIWDKFSIVITIISLIIAIISFQLYYNEISKIPDIMIHFITPTLEIGKSKFQYENGYSKPQKCILRLVNLGNKSSKNCHSKVYLNDKLKISSISSNLRSKHIPETKLFIVENELFSPISPSNNRVIGNFTFQIPDGKDDFFFSLCILNGDFDQKIALFFYDYSISNFKIRYFSKKKDAINEVNKLLNLNPPIYVY